MYLQRRPDLQSNKEHKSRSEHVAEGTGRRTLRLYHDNLVALRQATSYVSMNGLPPAGWDCTSARAVRPEHSHSVLNGDLALRFLRILLQLGDVQVRLFRIWPAIGRVGPANIPRLSGRDRI